MSRTEKLTLTGLCLALMLSTGCVKTVGLNECPDPLYPIPEGIAQGLSGYAPGTREDKWVVDFYLQQEDLAR